MTAATARIEQFGAVAVEATHICAQRGERVLTKPVSLALQSGDVLLLRGANGVGKSTLLRQLAGISQRDNAQIHRDGVALPPQMMCAYLGHQNGLHPHQRVLAALHEQMRFACGAEDETALRQIVRHYHLAPLLEAECAKLSAGQQRRVALARVALSERPVWLLDEPAAPLDVKAKTWLDSAVENHRRRGGIVIAAIHSVPDWPDASMLELTPP